MGKGVGIWRRLRGLLPVAAAALVVVLADQCLLALMDRGLVPDPLPQYNNRFANRPDGTPHLIVLGSSRGRDSLPVENLNKALAAAGVAYHAVNLSIGGGGTPSLIYAALRDRTSILDNMPAGSKVVYVFSLFELGFLQRDKMTALPSGIVMLDRFGMIHAGHWAYRLAPWSGFARFAVRRGWRLLPFPVMRALEDSAAPTDLSRRESICNLAGLPGYRPLPINLWALDQLAGELGDRLILIEAPVSDRQRNLDKEYRLEVAAMPALDGLLKQHRLSLLEPPPMPDAAFEENCDHLTRDEDRDRFAAYVVSHLP